MSVDQIKNSLFRAKATIEDDIDALLATEEEEVPAIDGGDAPRKVQTVVKVTENERDSWKVAADADGMSVSAWIRSLANYRYAELFECVHPLDQRRTYEWSDTCMKCGLRLR